MRSFKLERPSVPFGPPSWDLVRVLEYFHGPVFEPLSSTPLHIITMKTSFFVFFFVLLSLVTGKWVGAYYIFYIYFFFSLATAKWVGKLYALLQRVVSEGPDIFVSYLLEFMAKTESEMTPLSRSFVVTSLSEFIRDLPEGCL